jgi:hypothetical protein
MIRKFKFEAEIYESLNCLPMAARRKAGCSRDQTPSGAMGAARARGEVDDLSRSRGFRGGTECAENLHRRSSTGTYRLSGQDPFRRYAPVRQSARSPAADTGPPRTRAGVELDDKAWAALDDDQRYALIKLGDSERPSHNLELALQEFLEHGVQTEAS